MDFNFEYGERRIKEQDISFNSLFSNQNYFGSKKKITVISEQKFIYIIKYFISKITEIKNLKDHLKMLQDLLLSLLLKFLWME